MKKFLLPFFVVLLFLGCSASNPNYTMEISPAMLQSNVAKQFPLERELTVGKLKLEEPKIGLREGSDRMETGINFSYKPPIFSAQTGKVNISGKIFFNKEKKAFYLLEPKVDKLQFNNTSIPSMVSNNVKGIMGSVINEVFKQFPIYSLTPDTISGKILQKTVKNAEVKNGKLLVTFGVPEFK